MPTWQSQLQKLVQVGERLPDPLNEAFSARPPSGRSWPRHLPPAEVAARCDDLRAEAEKLG